MKRNELLLEVLREYVKLVQVLSESKLSNNEYRVTEMLEKIDVIQTELIKSESK